MLSCEMSRYANEKNTLGELKEFIALSMALEGKVIAERESLFTRLKEATTELVIKYILMSITDSYSFFFTTTSPRLLNEWEFYQAT